MGKCRVDGSGHSDIGRRIAGPKEKEERAMIRTILRDDTIALKGVIDATGLFPGEMLDGMLADVFTGEASPDIWLTDDDSGPIGLAYCAPERMTQGTWNLYLIAVHPDHQGQGRGTAMLRYVEQELAAKGERVLLVETSGLPASSVPERFIANWAIIRKRASGISIKPERTRSCSARH